MIILFYELLIIINNILNIILIMKLWINNKLEEPSKKL